MSALAFVNPYPGIKQNVFNAGFNYKKNLESPQNLGRAIAEFYDYYTLHGDAGIKPAMAEVADGLTNAYYLASDSQWHWFDQTMFPGDCVIPESLLYAWALTGNELYRYIATVSFDFFLSKITVNRKMNAGWSGVDLARLIMTLDKFYFMTGKPTYRYMLLVCVRHFITQINPLCTELEKNSADETIFKKFTMKKEIESGSGNFIYIPVVPMYNELKKTV